MEPKIKVGIVGAAGYTGGELIRLLLHHPKTEIAFALSRSQEKKQISDVHTDLLGETNLIFTAAATPVDVLFLCLPHMESRIWMKSHPLAATTKVIDLGNDFRIDASCKHGNFIYGLPEINTEALLQSRFVANPGCFATAIQLALLPLAKAKLLKTVYTTGITGATGAGQQLQETTHFSWRSNNISAYKTLQHQHVAEICKTLNRFNEENVHLEFVPWRGDFARGIFTSSTIETALGLHEIQLLYQEFYKGNPFVFLSKSNIDLKQVVNTNKCLLFLEKVDNHLVVHSVIDNLVKGASGQAVQNMNLMLGWEPSLGLKLKATAF